MIPKGPERPPRHLVWVERDGFAGWGCGVCSWVFNPSAWPAGTSLNEKIENSRSILAGDFKSHDCNNYHRSRVAKGSSS
jgi:hypothetical protein